MFNLLATAAGPTTIIATAFFAQATGFVPSDLAPLMNVGAIGAVLAWFLLKTEPRLRRVEEANDRQSRIIALAVIAMAEGKTSEAVKRQAEDVIKELDQAANERNSK